MVLTLSLLAFGAISTFIALYLFILLRRSRLKQEYNATKLAMFKKTFEVSEDAICVLSKDNRIVYANNALQTLLGLSYDFMQKPFDPMPMIKVKNEWVSLTDFIRDIGESDNERIYSFPYLSLLPSKHDPVIPVTIYINHASADKENEHRYTIVSIHDLRKETEKSALMHRHKLTKLPNQLQAKEDLNKLFSKIHLHEKKLALVLMDLDNLSQIRSMLGYEQTEQVIIKFAQYLQRIATSSSYYVYHTYSNSFLLCVPVIEREEEVLYVCKKIQRDLKSFYKINQMYFYLSASMGISIYPDSGSTRTLLDNAYKALAEAQKAGVGHIHVYKKDMLETQYDDLTLFNAVHEALEKNAFEVYYQPIIRGSDKKVVAAEALIRWQDKTYGFVPPDVFIPMLEKSGYIIELGKFVLSEVLKQQKRWEVFKFKPIAVSINMSFLELESDGFVENVKKQLELHQVPAELIKFEITENTSMQNELYVDKQLQALKKLGISISLDDFGTGYTSFSYLKRFPASIFKIDKSMVDRVVEKQEDQRIIKAMIELGHNLGMEIVAEGIETKAMADLVVSLGCDYLQGYYFAKPMPAYEFQEMLRG